MAKYIDPRSLGLPSRTIVEEIDTKTLAIVIKCKSRIIMADGIKILAKVAAIKTARPRVTVVLKTTAPICSKTLKCFEVNGLEVIQN
jgi:hypothetical protein